MKIRFITDSTNKRLAYILKQFLDFSVLDIEIEVQGPSASNPGEKNIYYLAGSPKEGQAKGIIIHSCGNWQINCGGRIDYDYKGRDFFAFAQFIKEKAAITDTEGAAFVNFDLFAQAFYQLSCYGEYALEAGGKSLCSKARGISDLNVFEEPNVNALFLLLEDLIAERFAIELPKGKRYPSGKEFCVVLTHDVDILKKSVKDRLKHVLHGINRIKRLSCSGRFAGIPRELIGTFAKVAGSGKYDNISYLEALEEKNDIRSSFNVYARNKLNKSGFMRWLYNPDYDISKDRLLAEKIRGLADKDFEIGIHGSYSCGKGGSTLSEEVKCLEKITRRKVIGGRQHFLDYSVAATPQAFSSAGIEYDTSVGFRDINGFRSGACLPYYLYSLAGDNATAVLEIPLLIMDGVLFDHGDGTKEGAWESARAVLEKVKRAKGCCSVVWHQRAFNNRDYPNWEELYLMLVAWVKDNNGVLLKPGELNSFWRNK